MQASLILGFCTFAYSGYVKDPSSIFIEKETKKYTFHIDGFTNIIYDRNIKQQEGASEIRLHGVSARFLYNNMFSVYTGAGSAEVEEEFMVGSNKVLWESDYGFIWLVGGTLKAYDKQIEVLNDSRLLCALDIQYRNTDLDANNVTIDSVSYSSSAPDISYSSMEYNDWHVALSCGLDMSILSPYLGIKYSDLESCMRVLRNGILYEKDNAEADNNIGIFLGTGIQITESFYGSVEVSFIDEEAISGSFSYKF